jgi:hypothetical protein
MTFPWMVNFFNPPRDQIRLEFASAISNITTWNWWNNTEIDIVIASIYHDWPAGNDAIFNFFVDGQVIWSGEDVTPPTFIDGGWAGPVSRRTFPAKSNDNMEVFYGVAAAGSGYETIITFTNGWSIRAVA